MYGSQMRHNLCSNPHFHNVMCLYNYISDSNWLARGTSEVVLLYHCLCSHLFKMNDVYIAISNGHTGILSKTVFKFYQCPGDEYDIL